MLESRLPFLPRFLGVEQCALSPTADQARKGAREMLTPISSTNTSRSGYTSPATVTFQAARWNSSLYSAPTVRFLTEAQPLQEALHRGNAQRLLRHRLQKQASVAYGSRGRFPYVLFGQPTCSLVGLRRSASGAFLGTSGAYRSASLI